MNLPKISRDENGNEIATINGFTGVLVREREERQNWRGKIPLDQYPVSDSNPETKVLPPLGQGPINQVVTIRYLRPPTPPPPGDLIIIQEKPFFPEPAPPLVLREIPKPQKPLEPKVYREAPPKMPPPIPQKIVRILPPKQPIPPRPLIFEKSKPNETAQPILIERWLTPTMQKRRVKGDGFDIDFRPPLSSTRPVKNEIIDYEPSRAPLKQDLRDLGIEKMNPNEYFEKYHSQLIDPQNLPEFARSIKPPSGYMWASDAKNLEPELEGDVQYLSKVDLDKEGLSQYVKYVRKSDINKPGNNEYSGGGGGYNGGTGGGSGYSGSSSGYSGGGGGYTGGTGGGSAYSGSGSGYPNGGSSYSGGNSGYSGGGVGYNNASSGGYIGSNTSSGGEKMRVTFYEQSSNERSNYSSNPQTALGVATTLAGTGRDEYGKSSTTF